MSHVQRGREALLKRTRRLKGQIDAVEKALLGGRGCDEVLQQLAAIRGAANSLMGQVLEGHVREHFRARSETDLSVVVAVLRRYLR
ncbi:MAG: metal/formaldehyde-sensitive transcriptional repressor [Gammaproteobacteria bacterium]